MAEKKPDPKAEDLKAKTVVLDAERTDPKEEPVVTGAEVLDDEKAGKGETQVLVPSKTSPADPLVITVNGDSYEVPLDKKVAVPNAVLGVLGDSGIPFEVI